MNFRFRDGEANFLVQPYAEAAVSGMLLWPEQQRQTQTCVNVDDDDIGVKKHGDRNDNRYFNSGRCYRRIVCFNTRVPMLTRLYIRNS